MTFLTFLKRLYSSSVAENFFSQNIEIDFKIFRLPLLTVVNVYPTEGVLIVISGLHIVCTGPTQHLYTSQLFVHKATIPN